MAVVNKILPCLWFDNEAENAAKFYTSVFKNSAIKTITRYGKAGFEIHGRPAGSVMTVSFTLEGQEFTALNGGPQFKFSEAISLEVRCKDQAEIDYLWDKLGEGGDPKAQVCGWLKDRFGLSWQIAPAEWPEMWAKAAPDQAERMMTAMLKMKKFDLAALKRAQAG
jgi:predicted 3-demethylubiquinone-9 3-methyltransferase (glyoxalase superfamily)